MKKFETQLLFLPSSTSVLKYVQVGVRRVQENGRAPRLKVGVTNERHLWKAFRKQRDQLCA
jgi:hypothetical protein